MSVFTISNPAHLSPNCRSCKHYFKAWEEVEVKRHNLMLILGSLVSKIEYMNGEACPWAKELSLAKEVIKGACRNW
jgi:hypothetical protein